jgi:shikimate dehydrogenase
VDELDGSAEAIGSVNTIVNTGGRLRAYNTDYLAVAKLLADRFGARAMTPACRPRVEGSRTLIA